MKTERRVYMPRWIAWAMLIFVVPVWLWSTYRVFFTEAGRADMGIGGWLVMTLVVMAVSVMLFLMAYRKLPAYIIEQEDRPSG